MTDYEVPEGYVLVPAVQEPGLKHTVSVRVNDTTIDRVERLANTFNPPLPRGQAVRWLLNLPMVEDLVQAREASDDG